MKKAYSLACIASIVLAVIFVGCGVENPVDEDQHITSENQNTDTKADVVTKADLQALVDLIDELHPENNVAEKYRKASSKSVVILAEDGAPVVSVWPSKVLAVKGTMATLAYAYDPEWTAHYANVNFSVKGGQEIEAGYVIGTFDENIGDGVLHFSVRHKNQTIHPRLYVPPHVDFDALKVWP